MSIQKFIKIAKREDGTFAILGAKRLIDCKDKHDVGAHIEEALWPLLEPMLDNGRNVVIRLDQ